MVSNVCPFGQHLLTRLKYSGKDLLMGGLEPKYAGSLGCTKNWNPLSMIALVDGRVHGKVEEPFAKSKLSLSWTDKFRQQE